MSTYEEQLVALSAISADIAYARAVERQGYGLDVYISVMKKVQKSAFDELGVEPSVLEVFETFEIDPLAKYMIKNTAEEMKLKA